MKKIKEKNKIRFLSNNKNQFIKNLLPDNFPNN